MQKELSDSSDSRGITLSMLLDKHVPLYKYKLYICNSTLYCYKITFDDN